MIDYSDPCSVGPLYCAVGCRADSDVESVSIFSGSRTPKNRKNVQTANVKANVNVNVNTNGNVPKWKSKSTGNDNDNSITDRLRSRISDFSKKGWLSQQEHRKYMALIQTAPGNASSAVNDHVLNELEKELDGMEQKFSGGTMMQKQTRVTNLLSPMVASCLPSSTQASNTEQPRRLSSFPQPKTAKPAVAANAPAPQKKPPPQNNNIRSSIVEPNQLENDLSQMELSELFTEMSFFARLGFVQPPCCLQCTYRESMKEAVPNMHCVRWVVWRKDAKQMLHPNQIDNGNLCVVRCTVARQLLAGKLVEGYKWDKELSQLIQPRVPTKLSKFNNSKSASSSLLEASKWSGA